MLNIQNYSSFVYSKKFQKRSRKWHGLSNKSRASLITQRTEPYHMPEPYHCCDTNEEHDSAAPCTTTENLWTMQLFLCVLSLLMVFIDINPALQFISSPRQYIVLSDNSLNDASLGETFGIPPQSRLLFFSILLLKKVILIFMLLFGRVQRKSNFIELKWRYRNVQRFMKDLAYSG